MSGPTPPLPSFHPARPGLVRPLAVDPKGELGPTKNQARGKKWRKTSHGFYLPADVDDSLVEQRIVEAGTLLPSYGGLTGWAGLRWGGATWFGGLFEDGATRRPVILAVMHNEVRSQPGVEVSSERLPPRDLMALDGMGLTTHVRSTCFEMRYASSDRRAVVALDMAAASDLVSIDEVAAHAATLSGWTGIPRCRWAIPLGDENSWSPQEVYMRLHWEVDAEFPHPLCNTPVFDRDGRHIGTPDLFDVEAGVVGEYDGSLHLEGKRRAKDLRREDAFRRVGLEYFTMVAADKADPWTSIVPRMIETRRRARWLAESRREWTVVPPPWWTPTTTVAQRRALTEHQRERFLRRPTG